MSTEVDVDCEQSVPRVSRTRRASPKRDCCLLRGTNCSTATGWTSPAARANLAVRVRRPLGDSVLRANLNSLQTEVRATSCFPRKAVLRRGRVFRRRLRLSRRSDSGGEASRAEACVPPGRVPESKSCGETGTSPMTSHSPAVPTYLQANPLTVVGAASWQAGLPQSRSSSWKGASQERPG